MKKVSRAIGLIAVFAVALGIYYYVTIPAINIHSVGFWQCLLFAIAILNVVYVFVKARQYSKSHGAMPSAKELFGSLKLAKVGIGIFVLLLLVFLVGAVLSSPIVNANKYQKILNVENSDFSEDIKEVSFNTIPLLDKNGQYGGYGFSV